jgi:oligosaccharyltransferase complex subunit beta
VGEEIKLSAVIAEGVGTQWAAYTGGNVQLELSMMEPYVRTNLKSEGKGMYSATVRVPDVHGVYTIKVHSNRKSLFTMLQIPK